jgi:6-phosphogluconolactonase
MSRHVFAHTDALAAEFVRMSAEAAAAAVADRGVFHMALTGGSAATSLYPVLAQAPLPWAQVHVYFGDERCVPREHADSNYRVAHEAFLSRVPLPPEHVHAVDGTLPPADAAAAYARALPDALDVVHLGMGPDGHVCSLFPGHALLQATGRVASLTDSPKPPPARVTLTLPELARSRALWLLVLGANKAEAVARVVLDAASDLPAAQACRGHANVTWLLDEAAAKNLKSG